MNKFGQGWWGVCHRRQRSRRKWCRSATVSSVVKAGHRKEDCSDVGTIDDEMPMVDAPTYIDECLLDLGIVDVHGGKEPEESDSVMESTRLGGDEVSGLYG